MKKSFTILLLLSICLNLTAQSKRVEITGTLFDLNSKGIESAHIINLNTNIGTISNSKGIFKLKVKEGDWIKITNLLYKQKTLKVTKTNIKTKSKIVYLISTINELEEIEIKRKMVGFLNQDRIKNAKDTTKKVDKDFYDFSKMDLKPEKKVYTKADAIYNTDPTIRNAPVSIVSATIPNLRLKRRRKLKKKLAFKASLPEELKTLLGEDYFFKKLKIPKEKYHHFIDYCTYVGIEQLYKDKKYVDLLKILLKESKSYLLILENGK